LNQIRSFRILNPRLCSANPRSKMTWWVPVTHSVPSGLRMRRASVSQRRLNSWSLLRPFERIESLCPESLCPPLSFRVLLGGSDETHELEIVR
jgi:hypothetical protein